jgi:type II secretory pathway pseudopilin PulG
MRTWLGTIRRTLTRESGIALPAAMIVLLILAGLTAAAVSASVSTSSSTKRDDNRKAALEAAEAGLKAATYRLTMIDPAINVEKPFEKPSCVGHSSTEEKKTSSTEYCESNREPLGNGAEFKFWTTPVLSSTGKCVGAVVTNSTATLGLAQRCVIADGTVGNVTRRLAARVATFIATPLFPVHGMTGLEKVILKGTDNVISALGTNKEISGVGTDTGSGEIVMGPSGKYSLPSGFTVTGTKVEPSPIILSPVSPKNSATVNENGRITSGADIHTGNVKYEASTRTLELKGNATLELGGAGTGIYNFCSFSADANSELIVAPGAKVEIIIDSPEDPGSGCPAGSGTFTFSGGLKNASNDPTALKIFVYGAGTDTYAGKVSAAATIFAPKATLVMQGNSTLTGGVAANVVEVGGKVNFTWDPREEQQEAEVVIQYYRTAWEECVASTETATAAGC